MTTEEIKERISSHEKMVHLIHFEMKRNVHPKSMFKGNYLNGQLGYHQNQIKILKQQLIDNDDSSTTGRGGK